MNDLPTRRAFNRAGAKSLDATVAAAVQQVKAERDEQYRQARAKQQEREANRTRYTRDQVLDARAVRDSNGWHRVIRVNAKSISVETPYSWIDRITFDKILEVLA